MKTKVVGGGSLGLCKQISENRFFPLFSPLRGKNWLLTPFPRFTPFFPLTREKRSPRFLPANPAFRDCFRGDPGWKISDPGQVTFSIVLSTCEPIYTILVKLLSWGWLQLLITPRGCFRGDLGLYIFGSGSGDIQHGLNSKVPVY